VAVALSRAVARSTIPSSLDPLRHASLICHVRTLAPLGRAADFSRHLYRVHLPAVRRQRPFDRDRRSQRGHPPIEVNRWARPMNIHPPATGTAPSDCLTLTDGVPDYECSVPIAERGTTMSIVVPPGCGLRDSEHATRLRKRILLRCRSCCHCHYSRDCPLRSGLFAPPWSWGRRWADLGIHRHTLRHRLCTAGPVMYADQDDSDAASRLWLALRAASLASAGCSVRRTLAVCRSGNPRSGRPARMRA
jgi:hypothetical protein